MINLLKSLVNVMILGVNAVVRSLGAESKLTFFKPTKALLIADVEQIEKELDESFNAKKI